MKPRLPVAPWTEEDSAIHWRLEVRGRWADESRTPLEYRPSDRRDADLMLEAQEIAQFGPAAIQLYGVNCRGWNIQAYWIDDDPPGVGTWHRL